MRITITALCLFSSFVFLPSMFGVPAKPGLIAVYCEDGKQTVRLIGDENFHQYFSEDGYPLAEKGGRFYYCDITAAGDVVETNLPLGSSSAAVEEYKQRFDKDGFGKRLERRHANMLETREISMSRPVRKTRGVASEEAAGPPYEMGYGLYPLSKGSRFPSYGEQKGLVILVEYNDVAFNLEDPADYFHRMLNEEGFSDYGATGSAADYFRYNSGDAFRPQFDVYGPVKLTKNHTYYGANDPWGNDLRPHQVVIEALDYLDDSVDFSQYDCDGDGFIDNVFIFYAGRGEASGGGVTTVWPHANSLVTLKEPDHVYDNVTADRYACTNEWMGSRPDGVGTFIHEFSHVMGLPDLYPTSYANSFSPDSWSAMDHGSYNNEGMTPPLYSAFERYALGWIRPNVVDRPVTATLHPIGNNMAGIIPTDRPTEFFLIENRQQTGWDKYIPGHGMLVWHIDYNDSIWTNNTVNNTPSHQYVDLVEADNILTDNSRSGDCFPGTANITSFTATTTPSMTTWGGKDLDFPITDIKELSDGTITFNISGGASSDIPVIEVADASDVTADGFSIGWTSVEGLDHLVSVYTRDSGDILFVEPYRFYNAGALSSLKIKGLEPTQTYFYTVTASNGWETGNPSEEKSVMTDRMNLSYYQVEAMEPEEISTDGFIARWNPLEGADGYIINLYKREEAGRNRETCDFSEGVTDLPQGWSSSSSASYGMDSFAGEAAPSLRLGVDGDHLESPLKEDGIVTLSFWHRGNGTDSDAALKVEAYSGEECRNVETVPVVTTAGGAVAELTLPDGTERVRIVFGNPSNTGSVALDDVTIVYGMNYEYRALDGSGSLDTGSATEYKFTGLAPETFFGYVVTAYDASFSSIPSEMVCVETKSVSSVEEVSEGGLIISLIGNEISAGDRYSELYDTCGKLVMTGKGTLVVPSPGIYILRLPEEGKAVKIIVR